jgi:hypothetical protein
MPNAYEENNQGREFKVGDRVVVRKKFHSSLAFERTGLGPFTITQTHIPDPRGTRWKTYGVRIKEFPAAYAAELFEFQTETNLSS